MSSSYTPAEIWGTTTSCTTASNVSTVTNSVSGATWTLTNTCIDIGQNDCAYCKTKLRGSTYDLCKPCLDLRKRSLIKKNRQGEYVKWDVEEKIEAIRPDTCDTITYDSTTGGAVMNIDWSTLYTTDSSSGT